MAKFDVVRRNTFLRYYKLRAQDKSLSSIFKNIDRMYDSGILDAIYDVNKSITQSLRAQTGKVLETIVQEALTARRVSFAAQVAVSGDPPHTLVGKKHDRKRVLDFVLPAPTKDLRKSIVISCKTSLRERFTQDAHVACAKRVLVTYQKDTARAEKAGFECIVLDRGKERRQLSQALSRLMSYDAYKRGVSRR